MPVRIRVAWKNPHKGMWTSWYKDYRLYIVDCYVSKTFQWTVKTPENEEIDGIAKDLNEAKEEVRQEIIKRETKTE